MAALEVEEADSEELWVVDAAGMGSAAEAAAEELAAARRVGVARASGAAKGEAEG